MNITDATIDQLRHELRYDSPWAWRMPRNGCAEMTDRAADLERLLTVRDWLESGGFLVVAEGRPVRWARLDQIEDWVRDTRDEETLARLEETGDETGDPWVAHLAGLDPDAAFAEVGAKLERYVEMFEDMRIAAEQD